MHAELPAPRADRFETRAFPAGARNETTQEEGEGRGEEKDVQKGLLCEWRRGMHEKVGGKGSRHWEQARHYGVAAHQLLSFSTGGWRVGRVRAAAAAAAAADAVAPGASDGRFTSGCTTGVGGAPGAPGNIVTAAVVARGATARCCGTCGSGGGGGGAAVTGVVAAEAVAEAAVAGATELLDAGGGVPAAVGLALAAAAAACWAAAAVAHSCAELPKNRDGDSASAE